VGAPAEEAAAQSRTEVPREELCDLYAESGRSGVHVHEHIALARERGTIEEYDGQTESQDPSHVTPSWSS
jgi:hypothetical protein